jgi:hypothetical protein
MDVSTDRNVDANVARGFGKEWSTFRQSEENLSREQRDRGGSRLRRQGTGVRFVGRTAGIGL